MKILIVSYNFPYPPTGGSIIRDYNLFKQLAKHHELYWIVVTKKDDVKEQDIHEMYKYFKEIAIIDLKSKHSGWDFFKSLFSKKPYIFNRFDLDIVSQKSLEIIERINIDLFFCDHIYLAQNIPPGIESRIPVIPNNEDHAFTYYYRLARSNDFVRALYAGLQWRKILKYEIEIYKKYGIDLTTSEKEKELLLAHENNLNIKVIPNGVDLDYYFPVERKNFTPNVVFVAWYKYFPNEQAVLNFVKNVFPLVKKQKKDFKFYVVGKEPPGSFSQLGYENDVIITGEVEDVRPYIANADAVVIPLSIGGGTRLKVLEAMGMGKPVISTTLGAEGLNAAHKENILIADDPKQFADYIIRLIDDIDYNKKLSLNGRTFVEKNYDWEEIGKKLNEIIVNLKKSNQIT